MLTVCVATTSLPRWKDDCRGTFVWEACRALQAAGLRVRVVAPLAPGAAERESWEGVEIRRHRYLPLARWERVFAGPGGLPAYWAAHRTGRLALAPFPLAHALAIARAARGCDLIHANWTLSAFAAALGAPLHRKPIVTTVQGSDIFQAMRLPLAGAAARFALRRSRRVIALSRALAESAAAQEAAPGKFTVIPNGVDTRRFHPGDVPRERLILSAGALIPRKGVRFLIEAFAAARPDFPEWHLAIVGDGPLRAELAALAASLGASEAVIFPGELPPPDTAEWMRRAAVFSLPSLEEGQGVVLLEALASGTPCIASRAGGIPEVLPPDAGLLVPAGDSRALAEALRRLMADAPSRDRMGKAGRAAACSDYDWSVIAGRIAGEYRRALDR